MYGQYGYIGPFSGSDGNSSHSESSFPGCSSKKKKRRVPLLGKRRQIPQPVPALPPLTVLKEIVKNEEIATSHTDESSDISLMSLPSDLSCDGGGGTMPGLNSISPHSDKRTVENSGGHFHSNTESQLNMEWTNSPLSMQELKVCNQPQHSDFCQGWPGQSENIIPECQAIGQSSEAHKTNGHFNDPGKYDFISEEIHRECLYSNSLPVNPQEERIVMNYDSCSNLHTCKSQKAKPVAQCHEGIYRSSALCEKTDDDKFHMGPPLMCNSLRANKLVFRDIINDQNILESKKNSADLRDIPKLMQASDENNKQMNINKENGIEVFAPNAAAVSRTGEKYNPPGNKIPILDSRPAIITKEIEFQMPARKDTTSEKQLDKKFGGYAPSCNLHMKENTPALNVIQHLKRNTKENDNYSKLPSVRLDMNKENYYQLPAKDYSTNEKHGHQQVADKRVLLCKPKMKETTPSFDDVISVKQEYQTAEAECQPVSLHKPSLRTVQECSGESKKEFHPVSMSGHSAVEGSVAAQDDVNKKQAVHANSGVKFLCQDQNISLKTAQKLDNYVTVKGKVYKILELLGRGGSSKVFEVRDASSTEVLAIKCVDLSAAEPSVAQGYLNEIKMLRRLQSSDTVISMTDFEYAEDRQMLYVVLEKGETDFSKLMKSISKTKHMPIITVIYYWVEILRAVKNIHENGVIHSDLKPANFLLVGGRLKLIDFGIASSIQSDMTSVFKDSPAGTFNYMSPEAIQATHNANGNKPGFKISYKSDIWSLGCILYNMLYGKTPFQHIVQPWAKIAAITNPCHSIDYPKTRNDCPPVLLEAVQLCLTFDPKKRPMAAELLELPYINYGTARRSSPESERNN